MNRTLGRLLVRAAFVLGIGTVVGKVAATMKKPEVGVERRRFVIAKSGRRTLAGVDAESHTEPPRP